MGINMKKIIKPNGKTIIRHTHILRIKTSSGRKANKNDNSEDKVQCKISDSISRKKNYK